jgi:hypothetical protein
MLLAVDPLLQRIEALPKRGSYALTFELADGQLRSVVVSGLTEGEAQAPAANLPDGVSAQAESALMATVRAFHAARSVAGAGRLRLVDIDGGWDVSVGNVVLGADGVPDCASHGPMSGDGEKYECAQCGAAAMFSAE